MTGRTAVTPGTWSLMMPSMPSEMSAEANMHDEHAPVISMVTTPVASSTPMS